MIATAPASKRKQFAGLEVCRFLCAIAVILWHYQGFLHRGLPDNSKVEENVEKLPFHQVLNFFYINGHHAVVIFWMISGFIFFWKYGESVHAKTVSCAFRACTRFIL